MLEFVGLVMEEEGGLPRYLVQEGFHPFPVQFHLAQGGGPPIRRAEGEPFEIDVVAGAHQQDPVDLPPLQLAVGVSGGQTGIDEAGMGGNHHFGGERLPSRLGEEPVDHGAKRWSVARVEGSGDGGRSYAHGYFPLTYSCYKYYSDFS